MCTAAVKGDGTYNVIPGFLMFTPIFWYRVLSCILKMQYLLWPIFFPLFSVYFTKPMP